MSAIVTVVNNIIITKDNNIPVSLFSDNEKEFTTKAVENDYRELAEVVEKATRAAIEAANG